MQESKLSTAQMPLPLGSGIDSHKNGFYIFCKITQTDGFFYAINTQRYNTRFAANTGIYEIQKDLGDLALHVQLSVLHIKKLY